MWSHTRQALCDPNTPSDAGKYRGHRYLLSCHGEPATNRQVLEAMADDGLFQQTFNDLLGASPFSAFRWETPGLRQNDLHKPFECVVLDAPDLIAAPDKTTFAQLFLAMGDATVGIFPNLGGDAMMVLPKPLTAADSYANIGDFVRGAPRSQQQALWRLCGESMLNSLGNERLWLNTAGGGVNWLHLRIDQRPKYYHYQPYRGQ